VMGTFARNGGGAEEVFAMRRRWQPFKGGDVINEKGNGEEEGWGARPAATWSKGRGCLTSNNGRHQPVGGGRGPMSDVTV
jgi:hypothetical protein